VVELKKNLGLTPSQAEQTAGKPAADLSQVERPVDKSSGKQSEVAQSEVPQPGSESVANLITSKTLLDSLQVHTVKRILAGDLPPGTSPVDYLKELQRIAALPSAELYAGSYYDTAMAAVIVPVRAPVNPPPANGAPSAGASPASGARSGVAAAISAPGPAVAPQTTTLFLTGQGSGWCIVVFYDADSGVIDSGYPVLRQNISSVFMSWDQTHFVR